MSDSTVRTNLSKAIDQLFELANDARDQWTEHKPFTPQAEYEFGYMNAMHPAIDIIKSSGMSA